MTIYSEFKPTYLYIKQHSLTGKLYLGKTGKFPETYLGSGKYWIKHIKKHGRKHVITVWYCLFFNHELCEELALQLSKINNIVDSDEWANLREENGCDGNPPGTNHRAGLTHSDLTKQRMSLSHTGTVPTELTKLKYSIAAKQRPANLKGMKWWNNGVMNKRSINCPGENFVPGQLRV